MHAAKLISALAEARISFRQNVSRGVLLVVRRAHDQLNSQ